MDRKEFLKMGCCAFAFMATQSAPSAAEDKPSPCDQKLTFIQNWVSDLMETLDNETDEATKIKVMSGCGRGCFNRHQFKKDIAEKGKGSVDKLIETYKQNFETWRDANSQKLVHIRYGEKNTYGCYCPAANYRPGKKNDIQCYCTRATHQAIWETALGYPVKIDILQSVRRGDPTCHFLVQLT